jgi:hypothetical protein
MKRLWGIAVLVSAWLGTAAQAQNVYPPSNILRVGSQLTFELRQQWTGTVAGKDPDGDWQGNARAANGTQGQFVGFAVPSSNNYAFQVGTATSSEYCVLTPSSVSSNSGGVVVYTGSRLSQQGNAQAVNDNATCRVTVNNGGGGTTTQPVQPPPTQPIQPPSQPVQPPSLPGTQTQAQLPALTFPPRLEVGQRWEFRLGNRAIVYRAALTAQENRNGTIVYTGTLVTDGAGDPIASRKLEVFFAQDTLAAYATDPQGGVTVCSFQGAASLQNNVLTGAVFYRAPGQQQFSTLTAASDAPCRANLEPIQGTGVVQPTNPIQPPSTQALSPSVPAQVGDTWRIAANGNVGLEPWTLQFTKSDQDGVTGTATQDTGRGDVSAFKTNDGGYAFLMGVNNRVVGCLLVANTPVTNGTLLGQLFEIVQVNGQNQARSLNTSCTATLTARGGSTGGTGVIPPPTQPLTASLPVQVGDTWSISASGYQPWTLQFTKLDDGDPAGTATQGNARGDAFAIKGNDGSHAFLMGIGGRNFYCFIQPNTRFQGNSILGGLGELIGSGNNAQAQNLNTPCTATLTARGGNTGGSTQPLAPTLTASFPPKPGQTWTLTIDGLAPWTMVFDRTNQDGVSGRATQNGVSSNAFAFVDGNENWFQVSGNGLVYFCIFPARPQVSGSSLVGGTAFSAPDPNAQLTRLNRACTATLTSQTLLSLYKSGFERQKMPIKRSPLF